MKPRSNRLGMYDDVRKILDAALAAGGGSYELPSYGQAVHWRHRAYKFRKLYAEIIADKNATATSSYDRLTFPTVPKDSSTVVIKVIGQHGTFTPANDPYMPNTEVIDNDMLFDVAAELAKKLGD